MSPLCRMAASRFGAGAVSRRSEVLARIAHRVDLADVGHRFVRCNTGGECLVQLSPISSGRDRDRV